MAEACKKPEVVCVNPRELRVEKKLQRSSKPGNKRASLNPAAALALAWGVKGNSK
jgi:hypothetical protein